MRWFNNLKISAKLLSGFAFVAFIATDDIDDAPAARAEINTAYLLGIAKCGGQVKLLLDIERVLSTSETIAMQSIIDARDAAA